MADVEEVYNHLDELVIEFQEAKKGGSASPGLVYLWLKDKKLKAFVSTGHDVTVFIEDAKAVLKLHKLSGQVVSDFVISIWRAVPVRQ